MMMLQMKSVTEALEVLQNNSIHDNINPREAWILLYELPRAAKEVYYGWVNHTYGNSK